DERVVRKPARRPAFAVVPPGGEVGGVQAARVFGRSLGAADADDPAGRVCPFGARDQSPAARRVFVGASGGLVVHVHLAMLAASQSDCGGGQQQTHPLSQFFALALSSSKVVTAVAIFSNSAGSRAATVAGLISISMPAAPAESPVTS